MRRWSETRGQASSEYVALVALVAVVLALAAGLTSGGVGGEVLAGIQRGLCRVTGTACPPPRPAAADLAPCPLERTTRRESLDGAVDFLNLGTSGKLTMVRTSDGRVVVSLIDGSTVKGEVGLGLHVSVGGRDGEEATAGLGANFESGRSWTLPNLAAARAFIERYGSKATIGGKAVDELRSDCSILCDLAGWRPHPELPPPDATYAAQGGLAEVNVPLVIASVKGSGSVLVGARTVRDGGSTWYLQLDVGYGLEAALGEDALTAGWQGQSVVSYTLDAYSRPSRIVVHSVTRAGGGAAFRGARSRLRANVKAGGQLVTELDGTLDLHDPQNRAAADAFIKALRHPWERGQLQRRAAAFHERIAAAGVVDRRTYELASSSFALGGRVAVGEQLGADFERQQEGMRLLSAETRLPGLPFLPRDDCRAA